MDVFFQPNHDIITFLGGPQQKQDGVKYRFTHFLIEDTTEDGRKILFNTFTKVGIILNQEEYDSIVNVTDTIWGNYAIENYILVPEDYDEASKIIEIRERDRVKDEDFLTKISEFTILPTTDCNARCFYCFENGHNVTVMSVEMAENVADYIIKHSKDFPSDTVMTLRWFGGEPLFNMKAIDIICGKLKENGVKFKSNIISNGYLFTPDVAEIAVKDWNMKSAQITLDGSNEIYKKVKNYIYDDEDPLETVLNNMEGMIKAGFEISVRMNVDLLNGEDLKVLVKKVFDRFGVNKKVFAYCHPVFETGLDDKTKRDPEDRKTVYKLTEELEKYMISLGQKPVMHSLSRNLRNHHCMVDGGKAVLILPDGKIGLCEHYTDCEYFGDINQPREEWDWDELNSLKEIHLLERCKTCPFFPECMRLTKCLDEYLCDDLVVEWRLRELKREIHDAIRKFYQNERNKQCGCPDNSNPRFDLYAGKIEFNNLVRFALYLDKKITRIKDQYNIDFSDLDDEYEESCKKAAEENKGKQK